MKEKTSISQKLQKFGSVLAGMVIPNIGAFIGFGLITAFFLETGWTPNAKLAKLISPILNYLLPILIGQLVVKCLVAIVVELSVLSLPWVRS